jgi:alkylated DNA repair dioxygenase AlkB
VNSGGGAAQQAELFAPPVPVLPEGMAFQEGFLTEQEEQALAWVIEQLPLQPMQYRQFTARREVASFGGQYDFSAGRLDQAQALPPALHPLRDKVAGWLGIAPDAFTQALVARYSEGTPLGWHRDVPDFEDVVGVSLLGEAVMRFRPYPPRDLKRSDVLKLVLRPRSIYLLRGPARWGWQHSVAPVRSLRYSITFRTARKRQG